MHALVALLKHRWYAKGRHGTHSPFVYNFIEQILQDTRIIDRKYVVELPGVALRFENIVSRIAQHNQYQTVVKQTEEREGMERTDMLVLDGLPVEWESFFNDNFKLLSANSIAVLTNIHKSPLHERVWSKLCKDKCVRMSIDLYGIGLLLFREEFKVKQHFILNPNP